MIEDAARRKRHRNERFVAAGIVLLLAAGAGYVWHYNSTTAGEIENQMYVPKATTITPELGLLQQYVRIDTSNPPGREIEGARWLAAILAKHGMKAEIIEPAPGRATVYARIRGKRPNEGLLLLHHIDVVPASAEGWKRPPFSAELDLNQIYGRGTLDNKGAGVLHLAAFLDVAASGRQPERDVVFLAVADEESGGTLGTRWLLEHRPDVFEGVRYALNEGGITEMQGERITYYGIETATKQTVTVMVEATRKEVLQETRIGLEPWFVRREPDRVLPEVKHFLATLAPHRVEYGKHLRDVDQTIAAGDFWNMPTGYRELTQDNVWAEGIAAYEGRYRMKVFLLNLPDTNPDERIAWLAAKVKTFGASVGEVVQKEGPTPISPIDTPLYTIVKEEAQQAFGDPPVGPEILNRSLNDSRFLRLHGILAYGINPFPIDFFQSQSIHGIDERLRADYFQAGLPFMKRVVSRYAFGPVTQSVSRPLQNTS